MIEELNNLHSFDEQQDTLFENNSSKVSTYYKVLEHPINEKVDFTRISEMSVIMKGDCNDCLPLLESNTIDLILTDPPYNLGNFMHKRNTNIVKMRKNHFAYSGWDNLAQEDWIVEMDSFFKESNRLLKKGGALLLFMSLMKVETIVKLAEKHKFYYKTTGVWHKTNPIPRNMNLHFVNSTEGWIYFINEKTTGTFNNHGAVIHDFIETSLTSQKEKKFGKHPTQKPVSVMSHFTKLLSNEYDVVLDPFMGSGSTGVSCKLNNRQFIGIEIDKKNFNLSKNRITNS